MTVPVVPLGTIVLKYLTQSLLFSLFITLERQRIFVTVSGVGSFSSVSSNWRVSVALSTISLAWTSECIDTRTSLGSVTENTCDSSTCSLLRTEEKCYANQNFTQSLLKHTFVWASPVIQPIFESIRSGRTRGCTVFQVMAAINELYTVLGYIKENSNRYDSVQFSFLGIVKFAFGSEGVNNNNNNNNKKNKKIIVY